MSKKSVFWPSLALFIVSLFFALFICEIILRFTYPQKLAYNVSQWDPDVGFVNIPGIDANSKNPDFDMHVKINSKGLRDFEIQYEKAPNTYRIGIFGDSFTFGEGVQNEEAYAKQLEKLLQTSIPGKKVEVLNFGIGKSGTSHQFAFYQKEGKKYSLDLVVVGFLSGNDFDDNWGGVYYLDNNKLIHVKAPCSSIRKIQKALYCVPFYKWLATHSHLVNLIRKSVTVYDDNKRMEQAIELNKKWAPETNAAKNEQTFSENAKYALTLKLIEEFRSAVLKNNSKFLLINLPTHGQKSLNRFDTKEAVPETILLCDRLLKDLKAEEIDVFDLVPLFPDVKDRTSYYLPQDGHMNAKGHQLVASALHDYLLSKYLNH